MYPTSLHLFLRFGEICSASCCDDFWLFLKDDWVDLKLPVRCACRKEPCLDPECSDFFDASGELKLGLA